MRSSKSRSRNKNRSRPQGGGNIVNRVFDSSGPEGKVRGTPAQIIEKYNQLARDAQLSNDRVALENFQQHSEHYTRILAAAQKEMDARQQPGGQQPSQHGQGQPQDDRGQDRQGYERQAQDRQGYERQDRDRQDRDRQDRDRQDRDRQDRPDRRGDGSDRNDGQVVQDDAPAEAVGRRGGRRRERGDDRSQQQDDGQQGQGGLPDVFEAPSEDPGPVATPEGVREADREERPKRARTRRKAPAPGAESGNEGGGRSQAPVIDDSAA